ncbi:hypothetical protein N6G94_05340 [Pediococcus inopinatus]|uniref:hypothetical protein n=1 Tax=Pediococcus inopinatus TaxID=114090 RepID=UPI002B259065|nr:hypothetical protein [Pediococcus inopinatus]WPC16626.1 hypothetical protein N6G94_05340 [Pediococcus inopinatus]
MENTLNLDQEKQLDFEKVADVVKQLEKDPQTLEKFSSVTSQRRFSSRKNKVTVPNNWHILSRSQAEWPSKTATAKKNGKSEIKTAITQNVEKAVKSDPTMSKKSNKYLNERLKPKSKIKRKKKKFRNYDNLLPKQQSVH